mgnify:CR=1 FL=1
MKRSHPVSIFLLLLSVSLVSQVPADEVIITASSTLPAGSTSDYSPSNVMDGTSASWSEGAPGPGIGASLRFEMRYPDMLRYVMISNGLGREKYWKANARIRKLKITDEHGNTRLLEVENTSKPRVYGLYDLKRDERGHLIDGQVLRGQDFRFEVLEVYPGERWEDLCVSEIGFNQWYYPAFEMDRSYLIKNLYMDYFGGVYDRDGTLLVDTDFEGFKAPEIIDGSIISNISSGDGTLGTREYQVFTDRASERYLVFCSLEQSEISQASMEGEVDENGEPFRTFTRQWRLDRFDTETGMFQQLSMEDREAYFDPPPARALSERTGNHLPEEAIWISLKGPGMLNVACPDCPGDPAPGILYVWEGGMFRIYSDQ